MKREILTAGELAAAIETLNGWKADDNVLKKKLQFDNFADALAFVNKVGAEAEAADHHPDISLGWGYAEIAFTTHDRGGITDLDVALAFRVDRI